MTSPANDGTDQPISVTDTDAADAVRAYHRAAGQVGEPDRWTTGVLAMLCHDRAARGCLIPLTVEDLRRATQAVRTLDAGQRGDLAILTADRVACRG